MGSSINIDFFTLVGPPGQFDLNVILPKVRAIYREPTSNTEYYGAALRLGYLAKKGKVWIGQATKIRQNVLPEIGSIYRSDTRQIEMNVDEGITESTHFLIEFDKFNDPIVVVQRNPAGISLYGIIHLLNHLLPNEDRMSCLPLLSKDSYKAIREFKTVKKFSIRYAGPRNVALQLDTDAGLDPMLNAISTQPPAEVNMDFVWGQPQAVTRNNLASYFSSVLSNYKDQKISRLRLEGTNDEDRAKSLDLLNLRLQRKVTFNNSDTVTKEDFFRLLNEVYQDALSELNAIYSND